MYVVVYNYILQYSVCYIIMHFSLTVSMSNDVIWRKKTEKELKYVNAECIFVMVYW